MFDGAGTGGGQGSEELLEEVRTVADSAPADAAAISTAWVGRELSTAEIETRRENVFKGAWR